MVDKLLCLNCYHEFLTLLFCLFWNILSVEQIVGKHNIFLIITISFKYEHNFIPFSVQISWIIQNNPVNFTMLQNWSTGVLIDNTHRSWDWFLLFPDHFSYTYVIRLPMKYHLISLFNFLGVEPFPSREVLDQVLNICPRQNHSIIELFLEFLTN